MKRTKTPRPSRSNGWVTLADLVHDLGDIGLERVCALPLPGMATEKDLIRIQTHEDRLCELIDGVLVEKIIGYTESCLTSDLARWIGNFVEEHDRGYTVLPDGPTRLWKGLVRMPDLSFISWSKLPTKEYPRTPVGLIIPNLAVEVLSESNTRGEMQRKRKEYFLAGVELVWEIDPSKRIVDVYTSPDELTTLGEEDILDGGTVLPGFALPLRRLFARVPTNLRRPAKKGKKK